jgi:hypothetical protein
VAAGARTTVAADADVSSTQLLPVPTALDLAEPSAGEQTVGQEPVPAPPRPAAPVGADGPVERHRRSRALVALVVAALLLVGAVGIALASSLGGENDPGPAASDESSTSKPGPKPSDGVSETPDPTPQEPETSQSEISPTSAATESPDSSAPAPIAGVDDPAGFVQDYYGLLPDDTRTSWGLLGATMQDEIGSYGSYRGFWATVDSVSVDGTEVVGDGVVDATLTYVTARGTETETRRITVADTEAGPRIVDDFAV